MQVSEKAPGLFLVASTLTQKGQMCEVFFDAALSAPDLQTSE